MTVPEQFKISDEAESFLKLLSYLLKRGQSWLAGFTPIRQGERSSQCCIASFAHAVVLFVTSCKDWNLVFFSHRWRDESEGMGVNHRICQTFRFNRGHVACDALASRTAILVVRREIWDPPRPEQPVCAYNEPDFHTVWMT